MSMTTSAAADSSWHADYRPNTIIRHSKFNSALFGAPTSSMIQTSIEHFTILLNVVVALAEFPLAGKTPLPFLS
jgi:hypothetical protein